MSGCEHPLSSFASSTENCLLVSVPIVFPFMPVKLSLCPFQRQGSLSCMQMAAFQVGTGFGLSFRNDKNCVCVCRRLLRPLWRLSVCLQASSSSSLASVCVSAGVFFVLFGVCLCVCRRLLRPLWRLSVCLQASSSSSLASVCAGCCYYILWYSLVRFV